MPECDIVVVGGSAGAIQAMQQLVGGLPADLPAAIFMVLHLAADYPSILPQILERAGSLPARHAVDGEPVKRGQILIAPPDRHLVIEDGHVRLTRGPRENRHRPAIDPLFRTAARTYDSRVIGVILSGQLDDGSAGLGAVHARGGICIVQDPENAAAPQMPQSALEYSEADYVLPADEIGPRITSLVATCGSDTVPKRSRKNARKNASIDPGLTRLRPQISVNNNEAEANLAVSRPDEGVGRPSAFSCPECSGVLWELKEGELTRFRCRVGHSYTTANLAEEQVRASEDALWAAMRALEEKASLATRVAETTGQPRLAQHFREQAEADRGYAETIRKMLFADDKEARAAS